MRNDVSKQTILAQLLQYFLPAVGALLIQFNSALRDVFFDPVGRFLRQNASKVKKALLVRKAVNDLGEALLAAMYMGTIRIFRWSRRRWFCREG